MSAKGVKVKVATKTKQARGAKRHRAILRDNDQGLTKQAISRLCYISGITRRSNELTNQLRGIIKDTLSNWIYKAVAVAQLERRKTLSYTDLFRTLQQLGTPIALQAGKELSVIPIYKRPKKATKSRRSILITIKRYQKLSNGLVFRRLAFFRLVKEVTQDYDADGQPMRVSAAFATNIQAAIEHKMIKLLQKANMAAHHAKRESVMPQDINFILALHA